MRLFFASFLSPEITEAYDAIVAGVVSDVPDTIRPVPSGTQHLTMVFLGDVADSDLPACMQVLECVRKIEPFGFTISQPRVLFSRRSPRLVCVDLASKGARVALVQERLHEEISDRLRNSIARPKPPHITLARFRKHASRDAARRVVESISQRDDPTRIRFERLVKVQLVKSTLTPKGPVYESVGEARLSGGVRS